MKKNLLIFLASLALSLCVTASYGQSILLGGFDGNQTQNTIAPASITSNSGVRELKEGFKQDAGAVGAVSARIWTDQGTNKELQWGVTNTSTTTGNWGLTNFTADASTASDSWVATQQNASWINYAITNSGTNDLTLDKFHISARGTSAANSFTTLTISLEQNGTFANPVVLSASPLTATGSQAISMTNDNGWHHYEFALSSILSDQTLSAGETATFRISNNAGTARTYLDNIAISGSVVSDPAGPVDAGTSTVVASPTSVTADGSSTSTITVTLKDASGILVSGEGVTLANTSGPGTPTITPAGEQTTNGSGVATFTVSSGTVGTEVFTATSSTDSTAVSQTASVEFTAVPVVDAGTSTVVASPTSVIADGSSTSTITVTLKDASGTLITVEDVTITNTSGSGTPTISPSSTQTTNGSGVATFTVSSSTVDTEVFTATSSTDSVTITQTASVQFTAVPTVGAVNAGTSTVVASPTSVNADGTTVSTITVTLKDANGLVVENEGVSLSNTSGPGSPNIVPIDIQSTDANGQATFAVSSTTPGTEVFTAIAITDSVTITQTASVEFIEVVAPLLVALLDDPVASSTSDSNGNPSNFYDTEMSLDYLGSRTLEGGAFISSGADSDGYTGDSVNSYTVIFDMGQIVTFDGFVHAQRNEATAASILSIDFWTTNTDPGTNFSALATTYYGTTPQASKSLNLGDRLLHEYVFSGAKLTGRYVIMRCYMGGNGGSGGYTLQLGQTASVGDYDTWRGSFPGLGSSSDDDDFDGLSNDEERLFGLNPLNARSATPFTTAFEASNGTFSYTRRTQSLTGMTYRVLYSTDLEQWFWDSGASQTVGISVADIETVGVSLDPALLDEFRLFVRLSADDLGPPPVISSLWGANTTITINYSEPMGGSAATASNYLVQQAGGGSVSVIGATLSGDGMSATLTLGSALDIGSSFTVTTNRIANGAGQPLGNGTSGQFQTWDDNPTGIKVFILAGQSNMVGYGHTETGQTGDGGIGTLRYLANNDATYSEYNYAALLENPGQPVTSPWATRSKVKLWWKNGGSGNLDGPLFKGDLGPLTSNGQWFGPEYAFGQVIGDLYPTDDILLIKTAWGGHKLVSDFRPPSAVAARGGEVGASYREIFDDARQVLDNLGTEFPEWAGRGYQIVGVAWHQGTSDKAPVEVALEYKYNLPDFISDVRSEFGKPNLPFVIATAGMSNAGPSEPAPYTGYSEVERAQLWVFPESPRPANVLSSDTRDFWEDAAVSPRNQGFHWNGNARSYFRVGKALGDDMATLLGAE